MLRFPIQQRPDWQAKAKDYGFNFHTMYGETYWDESAYYRFSLKQIEQDLEQPTEELHEMCLAVVEKVVHDELLLQRFCIPPHYWQFIQNSWQRGDPSLYSRLDFTYDGKNPAKLFENNADTPTSVYETGFWQWLWLEDQVDQQRLPRQADQFNSLQEKLIARFYELQQRWPSRKLHFASCQDSVEDRGTVQYLQDCAHYAGIPTRFVAIEDIGINEDNQFTDLESHEINWLFKLYPWEFLFVEEFGEHLTLDLTSFIEPPWKSILSNKALLPMLWRMFPNHPNLLPAYFEDELLQSSSSQPMIRKPLFSREGANIALIKDQKMMHGTPGPYGQEGYIYQAYAPLPVFADNHTLIGSWLVDKQAAGISIREDKNPITQDMSRYLPHIIM